MDRAPPRLGGLRLGGPRPAAAAVALLLCSMAAPATPAATGRPRMRTHLLPRFYDFHHCTEPAKHSLVVHNFTFFLDKYGGQYCDVDFDLVTTTNQLTGIRVTVHRCPLGSLTECEYFNTWNWLMPVCSFIVADKMVWTPLVHNLRPTFKCPVQSGRYEGRNTTLDFESLERMMTGMHLDKYAWPVKVILDGDRGATFVCFDFVAEVKRVRVRDH